MKNGNISLGELALWSGKLHCQSTWSREPRRSRELCFLTRNVYQNWLESLKRYLPKLWECGSDTLTFWKHNSDWLYSPDKERFFKSTLRTQLPLYWEQHLQDRRKRLDNQKEHFLAWCPPYTTAVPQFSVLQTFVTAHCLHRWTLHTLPLLLKLYLCRVL